MTTRCSRALAILAACVTLVGVPLGAPATTAPVATSSVVHARASASSSASGWFSANWSGYAITAGPYTRITASWVVPAVRATAAPTYSSSWIGIDGFTNASLIQTGTEQDYYGGVAHYSAWWEVLPADGVTITALAIHPGDRMTATISKTGTTGLWRITLANATTGKAFATSQPYGGKGASAEWIQEAPMVGSRQSTLAHVGLVTFVGSVNGHAAPLRAADRGTMVQRGIRVSTPTAQDSRTHAFSVRSTN
jgi:hypothetical protein